MTKLERLKKRHAAISSKIEKMEMQLNKLRAFKGDDSFWIKLNMKHLEAGKKILEKLEIKIKIEEMKQA